MDLLTHNNKNMYSFYNIILLETENFWEGRDIKEITTRYVKKRRQEMVNHGLLYYIIFTIVNNEYTTIIVHRN